MFAVDFDECVVASRSWRRVCPPHRSQRQRKPCDGDRTRRVSVIDGLAVFETRQTLRFLSLSLSRARARFKASIFTRRRRRLMSDSSICSTAHPSSHNHFLIHFITTLYFIWKLPSISSDNYPLFHLKTTLYFIWKLPSISSDNYPSENYPIFHLLTTFVISYLASISFHNHPPNIVTTLQFIS